MAPADVTVIGGSAAGLFCAYLLAREGVNVQLFDSNDVMHMTPRTLIVTSGLNEALGFVPSEAIVNEIRDIHLSAPNREVTVSLREPDLIVERAAIVRLLAQKAINAGVEIHSKTRLIGLRPAKNGIVATLRKASGDTIHVETCTLVGADGTSSLVGRLANGHAPETVPLLQAIVRLPPTTLENTTKVWFRPEDTPYFYWMIPHSKTEGAIGYIAGHGRHAWPKLAKFIGSLGLEYGEIQGCRIPLYSRKVSLGNRFCSADVYFVGDAAAQVKVTTVGGLVTGLRGAKAVAGRILQNSQFLQEEAELERELIIHHRLRQMLNRFRTKDYDRLVEMLNGRLRQLLYDNTRDELGKFALKLILAQPRLLRFVSMLLR